MELAEPGLEPSSICFSYAQVRKGTPGGRVTQGAGRPAVPEPESEEFVLFLFIFLGLAPGPYAGEVTPPCFQLPAPPGTLLHL